MIKLVEEILSLQDTEFKLPKIPYSTTDLKPVLSDIDIHYNKHHGSYVKKLNENIKDTKYQGQTLSDIIIKSYNDKNFDVYNNAAQHFNHSFFWSIFSKNGGGQPGGELKSFIEMNYETFKNFKDIVINEGVNHFGSGWAWVVKDGSKCNVVSMHDALNPITFGMFPIMVIDLWEHAYYIDYKNDREKFVKQIFNIIDWDIVEANFRNVL